jgi:hypothetical protein
MSDSIISVNIALLERHPELPGAHAMLERFSEHHAQSEARRKAHDELMRSDSNLELEDFASLAASALGENEAQSDVLGEEAQPFVSDAVNTSSDDAPPVEESSDADAPVEEQTETPSQEASVDGEPPVENEPADAPDEGESHEKLASTSETEQAQASTTKKRTRKRKKKKK